MSDLSLLVVQEDMAALAVVLQEWLRTDYPLGPSAAELIVEAKTVLALRGACKRFSEYDATKWAWGDEGEGMRFYIAEAREEAKFSGLDF